MYLLLLAGANAPLKCTAYENPHTLRTVLETALNRNILTWQRKVAFVFLFPTTDLMTQKNITKCTPLLKWCESNAVELTVHLESSFAVFKLIY
jgi:1,2-phenylacetyl-CoA epoxidase catalytic subunit